MSSGRWAPHSSREQPGSDSEASVQDGGSVPREGAAEGISGMVATGLEGRVFF